MTTTLSPNTKLPLRALGMLLAFTVLLSAGYTLFANLGEYRIVDYDEARHGVSAYEMIRSGDYLVNTYQGEPDLWNLKPPMSFWSIVLGYRLFGYNAFGMRFFSALSTMLCLLVMGWWAWRRMGGIPALLLMAVLAFNQGLYGNHFSRFADADALYQLFFTLSMLGMMESRRDLRWYCLSGIGFSLAFLTKATHALCIPAACLCFFVLNRQWRQLSWRRALCVLACALLPIAAWAAARYSVDGMTFFRGMFETDVAARIGEINTEGGAQSSALGYYLSTIVTRPSLAAGLCLSALCAVYMLIRRIKPDGDTRAAIVGSLLWLLVPIVIYTLTGVQYKWYVYSGFMAVPALTAAMVSAVLKGGIPLKPTVAVLGASALVLAFFGWQNIAYVSQITFDHRYQEVLREYLDRDIDTGMHMYIQYNEERDGGRLTTWQQGDMLQALFSGDVICLDGGVEAFQEDEEYALLILGRDGNMDVIDELGGLYIPRLEDGYIYMYEN